jgi:hypothetical protein
VNTIFYSWQSDTPAKEGRNFLEGALRAAVARISNDTEVEDAVREGLRLDKDTKGVPGSPPIFNTILAKIETAAVFVPDLSFTGRRVKGGSTPNPNVLIEYGWALKALGYSRIIPVMNEAHGLATSESMPFDMAHLRFPIRYNLIDGATEKERSSVRKELTDALEEALRVVIESGEITAAMSKAQRPQEDRPRIGMKVVNLSGPPPRGSVGAHTLSDEFRIRHLSGRPATSLEVAPISSLRGCFSLRLGSLPYITAGDEEVVSFEVYRNGERPSRKLIDALGWGKLLADFLWDSRTEDGIVSFPVIVRFRDDDAHREQRFNVAFDRNTYCFNVTDEIQLSWDGSGPK